MRECLGIFKNLACNVLVFISILVFSSTLAGMNKSINARESMYIYLFFD